MSGTPCRGSGPARGGFTLIEVIGALVIFSVGVLMVLNLTGALSRQMEVAAKTSVLVVRAQERLDSLEALPFESLTLGSEQETVSIRGADYVFTATVSEVTGVLYRMDISLVPTVAGTGPTHSLTSYAAARW